jgi:hypothetical protein
LCAYCFIARIGCRNALFLNTACKYHVTLCLFVLGGWCMVGAINECFCIPRKYHWINYKK